MTNRNKAKELLVVFKEIIPILISTNYLNHNKIIISFIISFKISFKALRNNRINLKKNTNLENDLMLRN